MSYGSEPLKEARGVLSRIGERIDRDPVLKEVLVRGKADYGDLTYHYGERVIKAATELVEIYELLLETVKIR